ncbi:MAG: FAD-dependent oxidoreductase [Gammaproteobacteria bacterium]|nr:FAD-dependent oxidoreductase [Gammaproteobacteria bacterium]
MRKDYHSVSFWHDSIADSVKLRPALTTDIQYEVVIIGAGYTGMWTAYYLKQINPDLDICILEAEIAGFGASGRNGGWCSSHLSGLDNWLANEKTRAGALHLKDLMFDTVKQIGLVTEKEGIDCHYERSGCLEVAVLPVHLKRLQNEWAHLNSLGLAGEHYNWLNEKEVRNLFNIDKALAGIHLQHCAAVHPARLARGLADCLESLGVKIYEHSPVEKIEGQLVTTAAGNAKGETVLITTEGYTANLTGHKHA